MKFSCIPDSGRCKKWTFNGLQIFHFVIAMCYLWAGMVEFIRNPPYFDAYGDAGISTALPSGLFKNNPIEAKEGLMRLMDLPILVILIGYTLVSIWLKFKGLSWLMTGCLTVMFLCFWVVNFWTQKYFDWRYYDSRLAGLELQVSSIALSGTMIFIVLFYKRRRLPFNFKSSLKVKKLGKLHVAWNFCSIYLIMFTSMLIWFLRMYVSWACFKSRDGDDLLQMCQTTDQVRCYPCKSCDISSMKESVRKHRKAFSCAEVDPDVANLGAFCMFNYNMGVFRFLETFAHVGGLSVFLSVFLKITGHYTLRGLFLLYDILRRAGNRSNRLIRSQRLRWSRGTSINQEMVQPGEDPEDNNNGFVIVDEDTAMYSSESDEEGTLINASCG